MPSLRSSRVAPDEEACAGSAVLLCSRMEDGNDSCAESTTGPPSAGAIDDAFGLGAVCSVSGAGSGIESLIVRRRHGIEDSASSVADLGRGEFAGLQSQMDALLEEMARMRCDFETRYTTLSRLVHQQVQGLSDLKVTVRQVVRRGPSSRPEGMLGDEDTWFNLPCDMQVRIGALEVSVVELRRDLGRVATSELGREVERGPQHHTVYTPTA